MNTIDSHKNLNKHLDLVAEVFLRQIIRKQYPEWVEHDGECNKCDEYYESLLDAVEIR